MCPTRRPSWPGSTRKRPSIRSARYGTTGYCMGGPIVMRTAGSLPERIGAGCTFHGGGLTTSNPDSPHLLIPKHESQHADRHRGQRRSEGPDVEGHPAQGVRRCEGVGGDRGVQGRRSRGWMPPDSQNHNAEAAERGCGNASWRCSRRRWRKACAAVAPGEPTQSVGVDKKEVACRIANWTAAQS